MGSSPIHRIASLAGLDTFTVWKTIVRSRRRTARGHFGREASFRLLAGRVHDVRLISRASVLPGWAKKILACQHRRFVRGVRRMIRENPGPAMLAKLMMLAEKWPKGPLPIRGAPEKARSIRILQRFLRAKVRALANSGFRKCSFADIRELHRLDPFPRDRRFRERLLHAAGEKACRRRDFWWLLSNQPDLRFDRYIRLATGLMLGGPRYGMDNLFGLMTVASREMPGSVQSSASADENCD